MAEYENLRIIDFLERNNASIETITPKQLKNLEKVDEITTFLRNPEWIYGKHAPASCTLESRYSWGGICVELDVKNGTITACSAYTDSLDWRLAQIIEGALIGCQFSKPAILASLVGKVSDHILADLSNLFEI